MNNKGVCSTAPATRGRLTIGLDTKFIEKVIYNSYLIFDDPYEDGLTRYIILLKLVYYSLKY